MSPLDMRDVSICLPDDLDLRDYADPCFKSASAPALVQAETRTGKHGAPRLPLQR